MAIPISPLDEPLQVLEEEEAASSPGSSLASFSPASLAALKRIKNVLIGNTNRKLELSSRPKEVALLVNLLNASKGDTSPSDASIQASAEVFAILGAMSIPREECLTILLQLGVPETLTNTLGLLLASPGRPDAAISSPLLVPCLRALRALYTAVVDYVDPLQAKAFTYDIIVNSALAKMKAPLASGPGSDGDSAFASGYTNNPRFANEGKMQNGRAATAANVSNRARITAFAETLLLNGEAPLLLSVLYTASSRISAELDSSAASLHQAYQVIRNICEILSSCTRSQKQHEAIFGVPVPSPSTSSMSTIDPTWLLFDVLDAAPAQVAESIVGALATLLKDERASKHRRITLVRLEESGPWDHIVARMSDKSPSMRLAAVECQVNLYRNMKKLAGEPQIPTAPVLASLLDLLNDPSPTISARSAFVLACLVHEDEALQETACNMEALEKLRDLLDRLALPVEPYETVEAAAARARQQEGVLMAIASLADDLEDIRRRVLETRLLPQIIDALSSPAPNVNCAAAQCARCLSRSVNILKTAFVDTNAAPALLALIGEDKEPLTQLATLAVISNLLVEFSPLKPVMLELDGSVERLVELTKLNRPFQPCEDGPKRRSMLMRTLIRHHALNAVNSLTYWSSSALKSRITRCLTWEYLVSLLRDVDPSVQSETLGILRNIACNDAKDIELVVRGIGEARLFSVTEETLRSSRSDMLEHALYLISNIATGTEGHRSAILNRQGITRAIYTHLAHPSSDIRVAAVWAIVNLCHRPEGLPSRRYNDNASRLRAIGIESRLREMRDDPSADVRERVQDALEGAFEADLGGMPGMLID